MNNKDFWPDLTNGESTKLIRELIKTLNQQLKTKYDGKIDSSFDVIHYKDSGIYAMNQTFAGIARLVGPIEEKDECEKNKEEVKVKPLNEYKFVIFNENYFSRIFDIKFGEFFPVEIRPAEGIIPNQEPKYKEIYNFSELEDVVQNYLQSQHVQDVIRYMLDIHS